MRIILIIIFITSFLFAGISSAGYIPIKKELRTDIHSVKVHNIVLQDEIIVLANYAVYFEDLVPQSTLQKKILPLYDVTDDFDFRIYVEKQMSEFFKKRYVVKATQFRTTPRAITHREYKKILAATKKGEAHVFTSTWYRIRHGLKTLDIFTNVSVVINPKFSKYVYALDDEPSFEEERNRHIYHQNLYIFQSKPVTSLQEWTANNGALYKQTLKKGIDEILRMIEIDIQRPERYYSLKKSKGDLVNVWSFNMLSGSKYRHKGFVLHKTENRIILRSRKTEAILSIHKSQMKK